MESFNKYNLLRVPLMLKDGDLGRGTSIDARGSHAKAYSTTTLETLFLSSTSTINRITIFFCLWFYPHLPHQNNSSSWVPDSRPTPRPEFPLSTSQRNSNHVTSSRQRLFLTSRQQKVHAMTPFVYNPEAHCYNPAAKSFDEVWSSIPQISISPAPEPEYYRYFNRILM